MARTYGMAAIRVILKNEATYLNAIVDRLYGSVTPTNRECERDFAILKQQLCMRHGFWKVLYGEATLRVKACYNLELAMERFSEQHELRKEARKLIDGSCTKAQRDREAAQKFSSVSAQTYQQHLRRERNQQDAQDITAGLQSVGFVAGKEEGQVALTKKGMLQWLQEVSANRGVDVEYSSRFSKAELQYAVREAVHRLQQVQSNHPNT